MTNVKRPKPEGGPWTDPDTWEDGVVPTAEDAVLVESVTVHPREDGTTSTVPDESWHIDPESPEWR